jgi:hypothetical protein
MNRPPVVGERFEAVRKLVLNDRVGDRFDLTPNHHQRQAPTILDRSLGPGGLLGRETDQDPL